MQNKHFLSVILVVLMVISPVLAVPTTQAVTGITAAQVTFNANGGAAGPAWFEWGSHDGRDWYWRTPNQTIGAGAFSDYQWGPPLLAGETYYVRACDSTGCDPNDVAFTTTASTGLTQTSFGIDMTSIRRTGFNISQTAPIIVRPYTNTMTAPIAYMLLFFFIFTGWWMRPKDITIPCIMAMFAGGAIWGAGAVFGGLPPEAMDIGQGLLYAAVAGLAFSWFTR